MFLFILGILAGAGIAMQSAVNAKLRAHLGRSFIVSLISFASAFCILLSIMALNGQIQPVLAQNWSNIPWWIWIGGILGMFGITANVLLFPKLGAMQTALLPMLGQIGMGLLIDHFGWLHMPRVPWTAARGTGLILILAGVVVAIVLPHWRNLQKIPAPSIATAHAPSTGAGLLRVAGVLAGVMIAAQSAINGELGRMLHSATASAAVSLGTGAVGLLLTVLFYEKSLPALRKSHAGQPWWIWMGGIFSALFIGSSVWLVPQIGPGSVIVLIQLGLVAGSLLVDQFGLFGAVRKPVTALQLLGLGLLLAGVGCIRLG